ncbi:MAG: DUF4252 domain-containing protein [Prevotella sp.]|nr:DUF4252 domain-containing protein [Prevotella sp.]
MKKHVIFLLLILSLSIAGYSQSVDQLLKKVSETEDVKKTDVDASMIKDMPSGKEIEGVEVYDLSSCSTKDKQDISKQVGKIKDSDGYETMMHIKEKNEVRIMAKNEGDVIKEIILLCMSGKNLVIIKITGTIEDFDIDNLIKN